MEGMKTGRGTMFFFCGLPGLLIAALMVCRLMSLQVFAEEGYDQVAGAGAMGSVNEELASYGMTPVTGELIEDGEYIVGVECSSAFFRIEQAKLTVRGGIMTAVLTMSSSSYSLVYPGTAQEAAAAPYEAYIPSVEIDTWDTFTIPVEALDAELDLAAFSKRKKKWYPRRILFHASDIPAEKLKFSYPDYEKISEAIVFYEENNAAAAAVSNAGADDGGAPAGDEAAGAERTAAGGAQSGGTVENAAGSDPESGGAAADTDASRAVPVEEDDGTYSIEVTLAGGSGRASVTSPTWLIVRDGRAYARILWSSSYYDYMILEGTKYINETADGSNSSFTIPITAMDAPMEVIADTTAMGDPVEIAYTLTFYSDTVGSKSRVPQEAAKRVLAGAAVFIVAGGILNGFNKKRRGI